MKGHLLYKVKEISSESASSNWVKSNNTSLFCCPDLLNMLGYKTRFFGGYKNDELLVIWPLVETKDSFNKPPSFSYYFGPYYVFDNANDSPYKHYRNNLEVFNCLNETIEKIASKIEFCLVPDFLDLRPFQWWNYHNDRGSKFEINLNYTAKYSFKSKISEKQLIASFRADDKRKKIRKLISNKSLKISSNMEFKPDDYLKFYENTLYANNAKLTFDEREALFKLLEYSKKKFNSPVSLKILELFKNGASNSLGFQLLLIGKNQCYAVAQSVNDEGKDCNGNIYLTYSALSYANKNSMILDLNGANSPNRADDKHAYGASILSYYDLKLR